MTRSPKLALYAGLAATAFVTALALGRPELAALGAPFALVLVVGLALPAPAAVKATLHPAQALAVEGETIDAELEVEATTACELQLALLLPDGLDSEDDGTLLLDLRGGEPRTLPLRLQCTHWGAHALGDLALRTADPLGLRFRDQRARGREVVRVYPEVARLPSLVPPLRTQPFAGNRVARVKGEGIEFADVRPYAAGDRVRRINWRQSASRQTLYVNQQHPERNSDVIVFLDSFAEVRGHGQSTLDHAVRAAASLVEHYLAERDRVGLVSFGGVVRWLAPASGATQLYRIVDALLETEVVFSFAWKDIDVLPARSLTPQALVIALSPLLDERSVRALLDLRGRGFDLVVVDVSPLSVADVPESRESRLAVRLWRLWREAVRFQYERVGVAVVDWDGERSLGEAIEEVRAFRRFARYVSA